MSLSLPILVQASLNGLLMGGVYALVAIGLTMQWGVMRIVNFAHGEFMMLSMYCSYWAFTLFSIDPYVSIVITVPLMFFFGVLIQKILIDKILEAPHYIQILLTVGLGVVLENLALYLWSPDYRTIKLGYLDSVIRIGDVFIGIPKLVAFIVSIFMACGLYLLLKKTTVGRAMRAVAEEKEGSFLVGINVTKIYSFAFGLCAACVGAAGALGIPFFYTQPRVGFSFILMAFVVVVLGSMGSFIGALIGGLIIGVIESISALLLPGTLKHLVTFTIFILVLLFKPEGLFGKKAL